MHGMMLRSCDAATLSFLPTGVSFTYTSCEAEQQDGMDQSVPTTAFRRAWWRRCGNATEADDSMISMPADCGIFIVMIPLDFKFPLSNSYKK